MNSVSSFKFAIPGIMTFPQSRQNAYTVQLKKHAEANTYGYNVVDLIIIVGKSEIQCCVFYNYD